MSDKAPADDDAVSQDDKRGHGLFVNIIETP